MDFTGKKILETNQLLKVAPQSATMLLNKSIASIVSKHSLQNLVAVASIQKVDGSIIDQYYYFDTVKNLALKKDTILLQQTRQNNQLAITLLSPTLKKNVQLATNISGEFSDNYFDLLPNQTQIIYFKPAQLLPLESIPLTTKFIYNKESKK